MHNIITAIIISTIAASAEAAIPEKWDVDLAAQPPQVFTLQRPRGETYELEAVLNVRGKPFAPAITNACIYWQTNGMANLYWAAPASVSNNVIRAFWLPEMDPGATTVRGYIGDPGHIYAAAFQFRFIASPGPTPNVLPLPTPVIDFAQVRVLNPPWPTSTGTDTNAVIAIANDTIATNDTVKALVTATNDLTSSVSSLESSKADKSDTFTKYESGTNATAKANAAIAAAGLATEEEAKAAYDLASAAKSTADGALNGAQSAYDLASAAKEAADGAMGGAQEACDLADAAQSAADAADAKADEAKTTANDANVWSMATYNFMTGGRTNCWFSGTNYVFGSDAATRTRFAWEDGMDAATVPCSMALWEIRDGERQLVWDQRDWTAWYWSFKSRQMMATVQGKIDALGNAVTNDANYAWSKRYASDGTPNPDSSTTFIDTPSVTLSPGMKWETVATVSGAAYWTIVGNGAVIGGSGTNAVLRITDFEGNDIMTVTKGEHRLAWLERGDITASLHDSDGWVCFDMLADVEPVGYFSTTLESSDFLPQTDPNCSAQYRWENIGGGKYRVHYLLKPGISANACFAKFQVKIVGQTIIRYNAGQEISGGLICNGVKIAPDISGSPAVGTVVQWKVVH